MTQTWEEKQGIPPGATLYRNGNRALAFWRNTEDLLTESYTLLQIENDREASVRDYIAESEIDDRLPDLMTWLSGIYSVAIYVVQQQYGGPEEGGWYYSAGELVLEQQTPLPRFFMSQEEAYTWASDINKQLYEPTASSSRIRYEARVYEGMFPQSFPNCKPHYE